MAWGVPLSAGSKSVLASEKGTPEGGGKVLLAEITPAEFEAAHTAGTQPRRRGPWPGDDRPSAVQ